MQDQWTRQVALLCEKELPYQPIILIFATSHISEQDCLPMLREPMPEVGIAFDTELLDALRAAYELNPSIHDGAITFERSSEAEPYVMTAWSMRIVCANVARAPQPNLGSAYNSVLSLSLSENIDKCAIISKNRATIFQDGVSSIIAP